jgi:hydroxymethylglutaryl-CoA reductase
VVASRILEAYEWAEIDPFRATTHNKGIMNGIDAVALATGQDWRAIEAACHAWAARDNGNQDTKYRPLTKYWVEEDEQLKLEGKTDHDCLVFCGELELPLMVGTKGGVMNTNPVYSYTLGLMGSPDSKGLAMVCIYISLSVQLDSPMHYLGFHLFFSPF